MRRSDSFRLVEREHFTRRDFLPVAQIHKRAALRVVTGSKQHELIVIFRFQFHLDPAGNFLSALVRGRTADQAVFGFGQNQVRTAAMAFGDIRKCPVAHGHFTVDEIARLNAIKRVNFSNRRVGLNRPVLSSIFPEFPIRMDMFKK
ncbi:hypothetical protein [Allobaculum sp. Allo2]|uniref:hypothetical protein n=1 Tax=Allobaculum sp. Allo2 TaxID=2853432 RepID=UPI001F615C47|nr:hypothetical protein [Allobaculum sp. Allo2]UNT93282.1 hypothetical protein KWG61_15155 [Allobaculum sp. Allo2]